MKKLLASLCLLAFCNLYTPVLANTVQENIAPVAIQEAATPVQVVAPVPKTVRVTANTVVPITVEKVETSKTVISGGSISAIIAEDVYVNNVKVFQEGDRASLNVISAKKAGFVGIPGEITISGGKVYDTKGIAHRVDYTAQLEGEEKTWPKVMLGCGIFIILAPLALFGFVKGGQAKVLPTTIIDTRLISEFEF